MSDKITKINTFVRDKEVKLSNELIEKIYQEIIVQFEDELDLTSVDFEISIEVVHEETIEEDLSDFNENLKKALGFNPKGKTK